MAATTATPTQPAPHFATLAAALQSGDRELLARTFGEMADELLEIATQAPSEELWLFIGGMHEGFYSLARDLKGLPV